MTVEGTKLTLELAAAANQDNIRAYDFVGTDVTDTAVKFEDGSLTLTGTAGELYTIEGQKGYFADYTEYDTIVVMFSGGGSRRVIQYMTNVHRIEKEFDGDVSEYEEGDILVYNNLIIRVLADGKYTEEEIPLNQVYSVLDVSGLQGAEVKWNGSKAAAQSSFRESTLYAAMMSAAVKEAEADLGTSSAIDKKISVGETDFDFHLEGEVDEATDTVIATVTADITFKVSVKLPGDRMVEEDVHINLTLKNTIKLDYRIKLDSTKTVGSHETSVPDPDTFAAYAITNTTTEISVHVDIPAGDEEEDSNKFFSKEALEKELEDLLNDMRENNELELPSLSIMIPAVPLLEFYIEPSIVNEREIEGELTLDATLTLGSSAGVYVLEKKDEGGKRQIKSFCKNEKPTITGNVEYHAQFDWSVKLRLEAGLRYARSISLGAFAQAGPELNIEGHAKFVFGTDVKPDFEAEGLLELGFKLDAGITAEVSLFGLATLGKGDVTLLTKTFTLFKAGSNEMPTRFQVVEKEPSVVWSGSYVSEFVDMNICWQSFVAWGIPSEHVRMASLEEVSFELADKGKPVTIDAKTGLITITDTSAAFNFNVKICFNSVNYFIYKIVPLRYTPGAITIIKTTEDGGPRTATFTVADLETGEFTTVRTTAAGKGMADAQPGHTYAVVESDVPAGYYPDKNRIVVTAAEQGVTVKFYNKKLPEDEPLDPGEQSTVTYPYATVNTTVPDNGDPSGFVYEGLESNRLSGVTVTLYTSTDGQGAGSVWDKAADFDQQNPLMTDALGQYLWMVPSGYWRVEYAKDGYDTCTSEWMTVPPVRTGVNRNMISTKPATATLTYSPELQAHVLRFDRPVQVADVMSVLNENWIYDCQAVDAGWSDTGDPAQSTLCATTFLLHVPGVVGELFEITGAVKTYMGTSSTVACEGEIVNPWETPDEYRVVVVNGSGSGSYAPGATVRVTPESRPGYRFTGWDVQSAETIDIVSNTFTMPACDVLLTAQFEPVQNPTPPTPPTQQGGLEITVTGNGSVAAVPEAPASGDTVTLTVTPGADSHLAALTVAFGGAVQELSGKDGVYTFTMPSVPVTVEAEFIRCPSLAFPDLDAGEWYHLYTDQVIKEGLMAGFEDGTFRPDDATTRAELVTVLWNREKRPQVDFLIPFTDVREGDWYAEAIRWAASEGIVNGFEDGTFRPDDLVSREEMAAIICRYEDGGFTGDWAFSLPYADLDKISDWAREAVAWCTMKSILQGKEDGLFDPAGVTLRCELAAVLTRLPENESK